MNRNFVVSLFGSFIGFGMLLLLLSAAGIVGARGADVARSDVSRVNEVSAATPLTSTFTYQGQLKTSSGSPVSATCDFQFGLWDSASGPAQIGITQTVSSVSVSGGLFTALLNIGNEFGNTAFNGNARWLSIAVRCPTGGAYTPLISRQPLTALPFALPGLRTFPNATSPNIIGGYSGNTIGGASSYGVTIGGGGEAGGLENSVQGSNATYATIGGGVANRINGTNVYHSVIGGGYSNTVSAVGATASGGDLNTASADFDTVGGGYHNTASGGNDATVGGGWLNNASNWHATVAGGEHNNASGNRATIGGGGGNSASSWNATVAGGDHNNASGDHATIGGGGFNFVSGYYATVAGGYTNTASNQYATVGGGVGNIASVNYATVGGGYRNTASNFYATVGGGISNTASGAGAFVGGGGYDGSNSAGNQATGNASTIGGGFRNLASGGDATVSGGISNTASGPGASVSGGYNSAGNWYATVAGGDSNNAGGDHATIGGGGFNTAGGYYATVGGGKSNFASGNYAAIPGGLYNSATMSYTFAAGRRAQANHDGAFVWADSTNANFYSTGNNQFLVRASGGITLYTNSAATVGASLYPGSGSWSVISDRNLKENFASVNNRDILARLASIPVQTWNYTTQDASIRHIGPMAQDFASAFNVGENNTTISTVDAQGVALAAIQGLYQQNQELKSQNADLTARLSKLEQNTTASNPPAQSEPFNVSTLLSAMALILVGGMWLQQRRSKRGQA